jgi:aryl-alcohol dehydrogenase-like predicted oxidoreductase
MEYRLLGGSGCAVSSPCLGTMTFGAETDEAGAHQQLDRFIEAGGIMVDTAGVYAGGRSEEIIGRWFASRPADVTEPVVLATKGRMPVDDSPNGAGLSARHLTRALDASLRRLGLESVDLYQVHAYDPLTPMQETLRALDRFVQAGKIRGVSMAEVALAWVTDRPAVSSTILGARTVEQLETNLRAAGLHLTAAETAALDAASDPHPPDYPTPRECRGSMTAATRTSRLSPRCPHSAACSPPPTSACCGIPPGSSCARSTPTAPAPAGRPGYRYACTLPAATARGPRSTPSTACGRSVPAAATPA